MRGQSNEAAPRARSAGSHLRVDVQNWTFCALVTLIGGVSRESAVKP